MCRVLAARDGSFGASDYARCRTFLVGLWHGSVDPDGTTLPSKIPLFGFVIGNYAPFVATLLRLDCLLCGDG
ncbi:hypothetical protein L484_021766 [Morus notabilis]|uniref:Uncharacterized protein n=1 Tax=Morus notabilis TaxID=981085 RepID=W9RWH5_9ROSA|nr:hypothetical protein L484_021766 [Morus notabilis]